MYISNTQKYYDKISPCQTRKGKALIGPVEGRIFKKFSKRTSDQIKSSKKDKKSFDSDDRSPFKARKGSRDKKSFDSDDRSPLKARKSLNSKDSSPYKARNDLNNPIDVCPNLERTSETTGEYERIGKNTKKDAITGLINHSSTKDKKSEIGRKRSGNKKIYTAESKKCTVRLTDIGTIKNLKTYVNKTEKKRKRRKICVKNL
ncbi:uncharacterized protein LOC134681103 [Mytilus trossulus]|uniref:uncharacterized protein LOC134681103 n=1 Tax=Mytilus trossulus TaxID=6551 RepID=UPI0030063E6D